MLGAMGGGAVLPLILGVVLSKTISKVLRTLTAEAKRLTEAILEGKLRTRGNPELVSLETGQLAEEGGQAVRKSAEAMELIRTSSGKIAAATVQQASNADEVSKAIQGISQVTEQAAAGSQQMASSSQELGVQAQAHRDLVSQFHTGSGSAGPERASPSNQAPSRTPQRSADAVAV